MALERDVDEIAVQEVVLGVSKARPKNKAERARGRGRGKGGKAGKVGRGQGRGRRGGKTRRGRALGASDKAEGEDEVAVEVEALTTPNFANFSQLSRARRCRLLKGLNIMWLAPFCHRTPSVKLV